MWLRDGFDNLIECSGTMFWCEFYKSEGNDMGKIVMQRGGDRETVFRGTQKATKEAYARIIGAIQMQLPYVELPQ